jgi:hypothetical protein
MNIGSVIRTSTSYIDYVKQLRQTGYRMIGHGAFAQVYGNNKLNTVIKIGLVDDWRCDSYVGFLRAVDPSNKMFPKIHSVQRLHYKGKEKSGIDNSHIPVEDRYYVVEMERLIPYNKVKRADVDDVLARHGVDSIFDFGTCWGRPKFKTNRAKTAMDILKKLYRRYDEDIHDGNVMFRKEKSGKLELVITDPVAHYQYMY